MEVLQNAQKFLVGKYMNVVPVPRVFIVARAYRTYRSFGYGYEGMQYRTHRSSGYVRA